MKIRQRIKRVTRARYGNMNETFYLLRSPANVAHLKRSIVQLSIADQERVALALLSPPQLAPALERAFFSLDENRFRQFTTLLDAPQNANPGLDRLMAVKAPWPEALDHKQEGPAPLEQLRGSVRRYDNPTDSVWPDGLEYQEHIRSEWDKPNEPKDNP